MNPECQQLEQMLVCLPLVETCDKVRSGALRMSTPFRYPNGEHIDVFLLSDKELFQDLFLTDYGQTSNYLRHAQISIDATSRRKELVADILSLSPVKLSGQQLIIRPASSDPQAVSDAIFQLTQMCVRISDLATHQRMRSTNAFRDDVEEFFDAQGLRFDRDVKLPAVFGKRDLRMGFEVKNGQKSAYVNVLAAMNEAAAHSSANEIAVKLGDLQRSGQVIMQKFVTVFNSQSTAFRLEDIERLRTLSNTVSYPAESESLVGLLRDDEWANIPVDI